LSKKEELPKDRVSQREVEVKGKVECSGVDSESSSLGDWIWIDPNGAQLAAKGLTKDIPYLLSAKNDALEEEKKKYPNVKKTKKGILKISPNMSI